MIKNNILALALVLLPLVCGARERSLSLQECLEISKSGNKDVINADLDTRIARAQRQETFALWFPKVSAGAFGFKFHDPMVKIGLNDVLGSTDAANNLKYYTQTIAGMSGINTEWTMLGNGYLGAINIVQPLFAGGRIASGNALAALGVKASDVKRELAMRENEDVVVRKYWGVVSLAEKKKALEQGLELIHSLENDVNAAYEAGVVRESDVLQVRLKAKELVSQMRRLCSGERLAKMDLFNCIGMEYRVLELDDITLSDGLESLLPPENYRQDEIAKAASLEESRLLEMSVEAKKLEKKMAVGEGLPQVSIGASGAYMKIIGDPRPNASVYAMVTIPLSDWSKTARKIKRAQYEVDKAQNEKDYLDKQLVLKISKDWMDLQCAWDQKEAAEESVRLSELIESQKKEEYEAGLCTISELLQCQTGLQSARSAYVDALVEYSNALETWKQ